MELPGAFGPYEKKNNNNSIFVLDAGSRGAHSVIRLGKFTTGSCG